MPTGYTAELCDKDVPFEKFVLTCARAFGALVEMREDPLDKPIPEKIEPSDYHAKALNDARKTLTRLEKMEPEEAMQEADAEFREREAYFEEHKRKTTATRNRLVAMRSKVADWQPPTNNHEGLKNFMIEQLDRTIKYDGEVHESLKPTHKTGAEWLAENIESAKHDIAYHTEQYGKDVERTRGRNDWVRELRASLEQITSR